MTPNRMTRGGPAVLVVLMVLMALGCKGSRSAVPPMTLPATTLPGSHGTFDVVTPPAVRPGEPAQFTLELRGEAGWLFREDRSALRVGTRGCAVAAMDGAPPRPAVPPPVEDNGLGIIRWWSLPHNVVLDGRGRAPAITVKLVPQAAAGAAPTTLGSREVCLVHVWASEAAQQTFHVAYDNRIAGSGGGAEER